MSVIDPVLPPPVSALVEDEQEPAPLLAEVKSPKSFASPVVDIVM